MDPFHVRSGWFVLDCQSFLIFAGDDLDKRTRRQVKSTISVLDLNSNDLADERYKWLDDFARGIFSFTFLEKWYPFLAHEIRRQRIENQLRTLLSD